MIKYYKTNRFYKIILIGFMSLILFASQSRTFYTFLNGQSFTYWNILNNTYIIPNKYYGIFPPLYSDYIKDSIFAFYIFENAKDKILVNPSHNMDLENKFKFNMSNKNHSFILMTKEEVNYYRNNSNLEHIQIHFTKYDIGYEKADFCKIYKIDKNGIKIEDYNQNYFSFYNYVLNLPILLFCFLFCITIIYSIMYLKNYNLQEYSNNVLKIILLDTIEFFLVNLIIWHIIILVIPYLGLIIVPFLFILGILFQSFKGKKFAQDYFRNKKLK
jgi:hypothetical protein